MSDKLADGRSFRILTVVDQFTREYVGLEADRSMTGMKVAQTLEQARHERGHLPESTTVDNGSEFCSRALVEWFSSLDDARAKLARFREHYNRERPHSALADRTPAAFAELHRSKEKSSTLMGCALQSLLIEPLERAKTASTAGERIYTAENL